MESWGKKVPRRGNGREKGPECYRKRKEAGRAGWGQAGWGEQGRSGRSSGRWGKWGVSANGYRVSFGGDENVLKLIT